MGGRSHCFKESQVPAEAEGLRRDTAAQAVARAAAADNPESEEGGALVRATVGVGWVDISAGHGRRVGRGHTLVDITVGGTQQAIGGYNSFPSGPHWWVTQPFLFAPSSFMTIL